MLFKNIYIFFLPWIALVTCFQNIIIENHGKSMDKLIVEGEELSTANVRYILYLYILSLGKLKI